jgi:hypothetical protein
VYLREIAGFDNDPAYSFFASLARVDIGSGGLAQRVADEISDHIRLGEPVTAVTDSGDRVDVVTAAGQTYSARRVVLAAPLNTLGDITFTPAVPAPLARLVRQGHTGRCIKVWSKLAGLEYVFAMGWPGIVECTVIGEVSERNGKRSIMASFGLAPDLAVDRVDLVQAGLDRLELGATVEEVYGHDWIGDPFSKGTWLALRPGQAPDLAAVESNWGAIHLAGADFAGVWSGGWTGPSVRPGDGGRRGCGPGRHASLRPNLPRPGNGCLPTELTAQPAAQGVGRLRLAVDDEHLPRCRREPGGPADEFVGVGVRGEHLQVGHLRVDRDPLAVDPDLTLTGRDGSPAGSGT